jgi:hypothetical protein
MISMASIFCIGIAKPSPYSTKQYRGDRGKAMFEKGVPNPNP